MAGSDCKDQLIVATFPLSTPIESVNGIANHDDETLIDYIIRFGDTMLKSHDVEIFQRIGNIIATEKGYFGAFWSGQVSKSHEAK